MKVSLNIPSINVTRANIMIGIKEVTAVDSAPWRATSQTAQQMHNNTESEIINITIY